jgi:hypothetical protein
MTNQHQITPSPSQLDRWEMVARATTNPSLLNEPAIRAGHFGVVHRKALRLAFAAGADQELEACSEWQKYHLHSGSQLNKQLRAARRPKPLSLKDQALEALERQAIRSIPSLVSNNDCDIIRRALEQLND